MPHQRCPIISSVLNITQVTTYYIANLNQTFTLTRNRDGDQTVLKVLDVQQIGEYNLSVQFSTEEVSFSAFVGKVVFKPKSKFQPPRFKEPLKGIEVSPNETVEVILP